LGEYRFMGKATNEVAKTEFRTADNADSGAGDPGESMEGGQSFMELFEESLKGIQEGKVVEGEIVEIGEEFVLVDIGYKSEGQIKASEFIDRDGRLTARVGDKVDVLLVRKENKDGRIILSKEKAARAKIWDDVEEAFKNEETVRGKIVSLVKGGLSVDIGVQAFLPGSQADVRPVRDLRTLIGTVHDFKIVKYEKNQGNIVLSRRAALEEEQKALREKTLQVLEKDAILDGIVTNIKDYGVFVDLGGIVGLLHISDMSWGRISHPSALYKIGDEIRVKVLKFDKQKDRVSLGLKQLTPDPWEGAEEKYPVDSRVKAKVLSLVDYGVFAEVEEGIEGLIQLSELSWTEKVRHPSHMLNPGDMVDAVVLGVDTAKRRISLSIKRVEPNPWDTIAQNYPVGAVIEGKIKNVNNFGIFIGIDQGIDGLVHISDISWTQRINHPSELYKKGDEVRAVILDIDRENERFSLGIKQLTPDPWETISEKYAQGDRVKCTVKSVTDFGVFVELEPGVEGLIHLTQLPKSKEGDPLKAFGIGDEIQAEILHVSPKDKRIGLSIRKLEQSAERDVQKGYTKDQRKATSNLGDLLIEKMMSLQPTSDTEEPASDQEEEDKP